MVTTGINNIRKENFKMFFSSIICFLLLIGVGFCPGHSFCLSANRRIISNPSLVYRIKHLKKESASWVIKHKASSLKASTSEQAINNNSDDDGRFAIPVENYLLLTVAV
jgi:hypothetical protein